ncbi:hypothetical protein ISCGN_009808 [Ixodes scapularis]
MTGREREREEVPKEAESVNSRWQCEDQHGLLPMVQLVQQRTGAARRMKSQENLVQPHRHDQLNVTRPSVQRGAVRCVPGVCACVLVTRDDIGTERKNKASEERLGDFEHRTVQGRSSTTRLGSKPMSKLLCSTGELNQNFTLTPVYEKWGPKWCIASPRAPKGPNLPRARLNHQDALFLGHGSPAGHRLGKRAPLESGKATLCILLCSHQRYGPCRHTWRMSHDRGKCAIRDRTAGTESSGVDSGRHPSTRSRGRSSVLPRPGGPEGSKHTPAQLNHQGPLFPGHGYATHSQTGVGEPTWLGVRSDATHQAPTKVGAPCVRVRWPTWLGSVVTLLTKDLAPKVQASPPGLGVRGEASPNTCFHRCPLRETLA